MFSSSMRTINFSCYEVCFDATHATMKCPILMYHMQLALMVSHNADNAFPWSLVFLQTLSLSIQPYLAIKWSWTWFTSFVWTKHLCFSIGHDTDFKSEKLERKGPRTITIYNLSRSKYIQLATPALYNVRSKAKKQAYQVNYCNNKNTAPKQTVPHSTIHSNDGETPWS